MFAVVLQLIEFGVLKHIGVFVGLEESMQLFTVCEHFYQHLHDRAFLIWRSFEGLQRLPQRACVDRDGLGHG